VKVSGDVKVSVDVKVSFGVGAFSLYLISHHSLSFGSKI